MQTLTTIQRPLVFSASQLTDQQRALVPTTVCNFIDAATIGTGQATFYNSKAQQREHIETAHQELMDLDRDLYAMVVSLPGVADLSRQMAVINLLTKRSPDRESNSDYEQAVVSQIVRSLPTQRMLKLFIMIRKAKLNSGAIKRLILTELLNAERLEFWAVKYRTKLRVALTHAWGQRMTSILAKILSKPTVARSTREASIVHKKLTRFASGNPSAVEQCVRFIMGQETGLTLTRLVDYRDAKVNFERGASLPVETMEGIRSRYHANRTSAEVLELSKKQLTAGQKIAIQRTAKAAKVDVDFDPTRYDSVKLYVHAYETGMTEPIQDALKANAEKTAKQFPLRYRRIGVLIDASQSMLGVASQAHRPIATALAMRDLLTEVAGQATVLTSHGQASGLGQLIQTSGDTSMSIELVRLLKDEPEVVFVLTDGYENAPAGRFSQTLAAIAEMGIDTPVIQMSPVLASESKGVRTLSPAIAAMPVSRTDALGLGFVKVLLATDLDRGLQALSVMSQVCISRPSVSLRVGTGSADSNTIVSVN